VRIPPVHAGPEILLQQVTSEQAVQCAERREIQEKFQHGAETCRDPERGAGKPDHERMQQSLQVRNEQAGGSVLPLQK